MPSVDVTRLAVSCASARLPAVVNRMEEALRTAVSDDHRLVLVRSVKLGAEASCSSHVRRTAAVLADWRAATAMARHGAEPGAGQANCVWFADAAEAEYLLLLELAKGRSPGDWYWALAVPHWQHRAFKPFAAQALRGALSAGNVHGLIRLIAVTAPVCLRTVCEGLDLSCSVAEANGWHGDNARPADTAQLLRGAGPVAAEPLQQPTRLRLAPATLDLCRKLLAVGEREGQIAAATLVRALLLLAVPALRLAPAQLERQAAHILAAIAIGGAAVPEAESSLDNPLNVRSGLARRGARAESATSASSALREQQAGLPTAALHRVNGRAGHEVPLSKEGDPEIAASILAINSAPVPRHSPHAGLWLLLPALADCGFRRWLMGQPMLLGDDPGRGLLRSIAVRHRVAGNDPVLLPLPADAAQPLHQPWMHPWRRAVDGLLRRRAGLRLHDLCDWAGWLELVDDQLQVHFPEGRMHLGLRRHALDRDPGWVDWLGLCVRFHFRAPEHRL